MRLRKRQHDTIISIHALHEESDQPVATNYSHPQIDFNPRSP